MLRGISLSVLALTLASCGGSGIEGTLQWAQPPAVSGRSVNGSLQNTTSHSVTVEAKRIRLLDDRGRKVAARIRLSSTDLAAGASTSVSATWKSGKPVRIDYGSGTLALPSH
ncbi:MAG: hypothetical protein QOJ29_3106 [Thermoleophilaceae bacterium]|jgi:hypothetical protein|nr:hypothetical protein [Thermoleophilaceae bacterium]